MRCMSVKNRGIGPGHQPYVIAEIGVNHDGCVQRALDLVVSAAEAGADAIKLQIFDADLLVSRDARLVQYQQQAGAENPSKMLQHLQLAMSDFEIVVAASHKLGLHAIATIFNKELVADAALLGWDLPQVRLWRHHQPAAPDGDGANRITDDCQYWRLNH